jgi:hypothetical protein
MTMYNQVERYEASDGKRAVALYVGDHGLVRYSALDWQEPDPDNPYEVKGYWLPVHESGIYENADDARRAAASEIDWLEEALRNSEPRSE